MSGGLQASDAVTPASHRKLYPLFPPLVGSHPPDPWTPEPSTAMPSSLLLPYTPHPSSIPAAPPVKYEPAPGASIRCTAPAKKIDHRYITKVLTAPPPSPDAPPPLWAEATAATPLTIDCNNPFHQNARWQVRLCRRSLRSARAERGAVTHGEQWLVETGVIRPLLPPSTATGRNWGISCQDLFHTSQSPTTLTLFL